MMVYSSKQILLVLIVMITVLMTGCSSNKIKSEEKSPEPKLPIELKEIDSNLEMFINELENFMFEKIKKQVEAAENTEIKQGSGRKNKQQTKQDNEQKQQQGKSEKDEEEEKQRWKTYDKKVEELHDLWNDALPLITGEVGFSVIDSFSKGLNELTVKENTRECYQTLYSANELYKHMSDIYKNYKADSPIALKNTTYLVRKIVITGFGDDWEKSKAICAELKNYWDTTKASIKKPKADIKEKLEFSIDELGNSLDKKDKILLKIKGDIVIKNLKEIKKLYQQAK